MAEVGPLANTPAVGPDSVRVHVARLLDSDTFANAPSLRRLLSYVVDQSLEGKAAVVKEYAIGVEVFDRGESFDPRTDTIVRVQARRLRAKLETYYAREGYADAIVIELPKGGYLPNFRSVTVSDRPSVSNAGQGWSWREGGHQPPRATPGERAVPSVPVPRASVIGREAEIAHLRSLLLSRDSHLILRKGREAYARRAWQDAYRAFLCADEATRLEADDLERLATAAYLIGRELEFQRFIERLHRVHLEADHAERAARCAFWLAISFFFRGDVGQSNAWTARGQRLVQDRDCVEHGYLLVVAATQQLHDGHAESAQGTATEATAIGERCHDADLTAAARHLQGRAYIRQGQVAPGLKLLDETMLAVVAGELSPIMTGLMYCAVIEACRDVYELRRAREWTFALSRWCEQQSELVAFTGVCLVHRAEIMQFHGAWPEALAEAGRACERSQQSVPRPPGAAFYQQAEIYRLRGESAKADEAYRDASRLGYEPQPGLALLRLAQGRTDAASAAIRRLLIATTDRLRRARLLPAYLEIMLAAGDVEDARSACQELQALAQAFDTDVLRAVAAQAHGALALGHGDARAAIGPLRRAFELWERLEAPYETARVRVLVGQACQALGDDEAAGLEFDAAQSVFTQLGAQPDLARLDTTRTPTSPPGPLTARELDVLRLIAAGHTNKGIAGELCLSERTIERHVSNILSKLDVRSRAAATAYACDHKLI